jgi:hypothetical protein
MTTLIVSAAPMLNLFGPWIFRGKELNLRCCEAGASKELHGCRMIKPDHPKLPIVMQCELLGLAGANHYHKAEPETDTNLAAHAGDRRDVPGVPGLRLPADDPLAVR